MLSRSMRRLFPVLLGLGVVGALIWQWRSATVSAARAQLASGPPPSAPSLRVRAEGRLVAYPEAEASVGAEVGGTLCRVLVAERQRVRRGQLLAELAADAQRAALTEARARGAQVDVQLRFLEGEVGRARRLHAAGALAAQALDRALRDRDAARAERVVAAATTRRLAVELAKTRIVAPIDGTVVARLAQAGDSVTPGVRLFAIADLDRTRIEAEIDEYDAARVRLGAAVRIAAEGYGTGWRGRVEEVPDSVTGRRLRPQDPGRPSDTRVLLVKIALLDRTPLKLGQRVEVELVPR